MEKVKIYVETKGVGDVVYDELKEIISRDRVLSRLTTLRKVPADTTVIIKGKE